MGRAPALGAHLHHPPVFARGRQHGLALHHVHADRLLHVDVGARLDRLQERQGVPVVGGRDEHQVEVLLREHLPVVAVRARCLLRDLAARDLLGGVGEHRAVDVAERHHLDRRDLDQPEQVGLAIPAGADEADPERGVREGLGVASEAAGWRRRARPRSTGTGGGSSAWPPEGRPNHSADGRRPDGSYGFRGPRKVQVPRSSKIVGVFLRSVPSPRRRTGSGPWAPRCGRRGRPFRFPRRSRGSPGSGIGRHGP